MHCEILKAKAPQVREGMLSSKVSMKNLDCGQPRLYMKAYGQRTDHRELAAH